MPRPGAIAFTVMPCGPHSRAAERVKRLDRALGRVVVDRVPRARHHVERAEVDDAPVVLVAHVREHRLHRPERRPRPRLERRGHHLVGLLLERHQLGERLRVVHEDVDPAELGDRRLDHALDLLLARHVGRARTSPRAPSSSASSRATRSPSSSRSSATTMAAPSRASRRATPRPMPIPAPVTIATRPASRSPTAATYATVPIRLGSRLKPTSAQSDGR